MTGKPVGPARMDKRFTGDISGRATTLSTYALDHSTDIGTDRSDESFSIIPSRGTGYLSGTTCTGGLTSEMEGTHRIWLS